MSVYLREMILDEPQKFVRILLPEHLRRPDEIAITIRVIEETSDSYVLERDFSGWPAKSTFRISKDSPNIIATITY